MSFTVPPRSLSLRWSAILCGVAILIWSTPEEDRPIFSAALGVWLALTALLWWITGRFPGVTLRGPLLLAGFAFAGAVGGAASNLCAVLLMIFKDARHAHPFPDYPPALLGAMLSRLPAWMLAGMLIGIGAGLLLGARRISAPDTDSPETPPVL